MIDFVWTVFATASWLFVALWLIPTIIAHKRKHRNKVVIFVMSIIASVLPVSIFVFLGYIILLAFSLYRSPDIVVVQGPRGEPGPKGKDADEIPLSAAGVVKPKNSDPYKDVDPYNF